MRILNLHSAFVLHYSHLNFILLHQILQNVDNILGKTEFLSTLYETIQEKELLFLFIFS